MNLKNIKIKLVLLFVLIANMLTAQDINTKITIVSPYEPSISDATKINTMPVFNDTTKIHPNYNYSIQPNKLGTDFIPRAISPAKMINEPLPQLYNSYLKLGLGNYVTPLAEINISSLRSKNSVFGFYAKHISSHSNIKLDNNEKMWAGYNDNIVRTYGKRIWNNFTLNADGGFKHNTVYYYGFNADTTMNLPSNKNDYRQDFLNMDGHINFESNHPYDSNKIYYLIDAKYNYITDKFFTRSYFNNFEHAVHVNGLVKKNINGFYGSLFAGVDNYNKSSSIDPSTTTIVTLHPSVTRTSHDWKFNAGLKIMIDNYGVNNFLHVYPDLNFEFNAVQDVVRAYLGMNGGIKANSYAEIVTENPFIVPNLIVRNATLKGNGGLTNQRLNVFGGLKGSLSKAIEFNLSVAFIQIDNQYFFVNDTMNHKFFATDNKYIAGNQFIVVYDDVQLIKYKAECNIRFSSKLNMITKLEVNDYTHLTKQTKAWNIPAVKASISPYYNLRNKILVNADFNYIGKRYARGKTNADVIALDQFIDLNLGIEYRYTKMLSFFLKFNNLAAYKYYMWNQYPTQRFFIMGGFTYIL